MSIPPCVYDCYFSKIILKAYLFVGKPCKHTSYIWKQMWRAFKFKFVNWTKYVSNFHSQIPFETAVKTDKREYVSEHDDAPTPENRNKRPSGKSPVGLRVQVGR